jgi:hypothetical protein
MADPDLILVGWRALGYQIGRVVHDTSRNRGYRLTRNGQSFFAKVNLTKKPVAMENDAWWALTMARLTASDPDVPVRAPKLYEYGPGWLIIEWIDAPILEALGFDLGEAKIAPHVNRLTDALLWLDGLWQPTTTKLIYDSTDSAPYTNLTRMIDGWLQQPLAIGTVKPADVKAAKQLIADYRPHLHPAFQHGDFVPWHLFAISDRQLVLLDGEHASLVKPRYYDLAYLYSRLYTRAAAPEAARAILKRYLESAGHEVAEFASAFLPVITLRTLGIHADAYADRERFDYHDRAADLLARCLTRDLQAFMNFL